MRKPVVAVAALILCAVFAVALLGCSKGAYVGSTMSNRFHDPTCMWAEELDRNRQVWFETREEAENAGYEPCQTCLPELTSSSDSK